MNKSAYAQAEANIISAYLLNPDASRGPCSRLTTAHFVDKNCQNLFAGIIAAEADGVPITPEAIQFRLIQQGTPVDASVIAALEQGPAFLEQPWINVLLERHTQFEIVKLVQKGAKVAEFRALLSESAEPPKDKFPPIVDGRTLLITESETPAEIVSGLLHRGSKLVLGGGSKSYKTWGLLDLAVSVAAGVRWIGRETFPCKVLYLNFEIQPEFFCRRLIAVREAKQISEFEDSPDVWNLRGYSADADLLIPEIQDRIVERGYGLIVLDPIYKIIGQADENSARDIGRIMNRLERMAAATTAAIAFGAHFSKGNQAGKESMDRISGSGVFARDPDSILTFTRHQEDGAFSVESTLRNFPPLDPFAVRWSYPLFRPDGQLDPAKLKQVGGRAKSHDMQDLLELLPGAGSLATEWMQKAKEEAGMSERTFYRLKKELVAAKQVIQSTTDDKWKPITQTVKK